MFQRVHRFGKNCICTCIYTSLCALNSRLDTFLLERVSARHNVELIINTRINSRFDTVNHFALANYFFVWTVATAFLRNLILNMKTCGAGTAHFFYRTSNVECATPTGIGVNQQW